MSQCFLSSGIARGNDKDYFSSSEAVSLWTALGGLELADWTAFVSGVWGLMAWTFKIKIWLRNLMSIVFYTCLLGPV